VEVQGTAEVVAFSRPDLDQLLGLADIGLGRIFSLQSDLLAEAPVSRPISR
jgi:ribonuclease PH